MAERTEHHFGDGNGIVVISHRNASNGAQIYSRAMFAPIVLY